MTNKKTPLRDRKRRTARRVASTRSIILGGTSILAGVGYPCSGVSLQPKDLGPETRVPLRRDMGPETGVVTPCELKNKLKTLPSRNLRLRAVPNGHSFLLFSFLPLIALHPHIKCFGKIDRVNKYYKGVFTKVSENVIRQLSLISKFNFKLSIHN